MIYYSIFCFQFSLFNFQQNKLYPNGHCCSKCRMMLQSPFLVDFSNSFLSEEFWYIPSQHKVLDLCWDKWSLFHGQDWYEVNLWLEYANTI